MSAARPMRPPVAAALITTALLAGCAAPQSESLRARPPAGLSTVRELGQVPFFPQQRLQCGPAALAMVLAADGPAPTPEELETELYLPSRAGTLAPEMLAATRRHGRLAVLLPPELPALLAQVDAGRPVVVLQNLSLPWFPMWHYAVVIGYDLGRARIELHSGGEPRQWLPMSQFEHTWARSGHWAMVATDPAQPPAGLDDSLLLDSAAALERVDPAPARRAYRALAQRSPTLFGAWMGLGNTAAAAGEANAAVAAFQAAVDLQPANADAWNNLASTLLDSGRAPEARVAVQRALALGAGTSNHATYERTATEIEGALAR